MHMRLSLPNKLLMLLACGLLLVPILYAPAVSLRMSSSRVPMDLMSQARSAVMGGNVPWIVVATICLLVVLASWWRRGTGAISIVVLSVMGATAFGMVALQTAPPAVIDFDIQPGTKMWCNDVYLGEAPLQMSVREFYSRVKPVQSPPAQENAVVDSSMDDQYGWSFAKWSLISGDPTYSGSHRTWPHADGYARTMAAMRGEQYWWRFERDGYASISHGFYFSGTASNGRYQGFRSPEFPAEVRHREVLRELLVGTQYEPDDAFWAHVKAYGLEEYAGSVLKDQSPGSPSRMTSASDANERFMELVSSIAASGHIADSSAEMIELAALTKLYPEVVRDRLSLVLDFGSRSRSPLQQYETQLVEKLALEQRIIDEDLFDEMVFHKKWQFWPLYDRPEVPGLVRDYLKQRNAKYRNVVFIRNELETLMSSNDLRVHVIIRGYLEGVDFSVARVVKKFVRRQVELGVDPVELADWVEANPVQHDNGTATLLALIGPPDFAERMRSREDAVLQLVHEDLTNSGGSVIEYMIDSARDVPREKANWFMTILAKNVGHQRVREFMREEIQAGAQPAARLANYLSGVPSEAMSWFVEPLLEQLDVVEDTSDRQPLLRMLYQIGTPRAWDRIEKLAESDKQCQRYLDMREEKKAVANRKRLENVRLARDLIAGKIKPESLLETDRYVWGKRGYEKAEE